MISLSTCIHTFISVDSFGYNFFSNDTYLLYSLPCSIYVQRYIIFYGLEPTWMVCPIHRLPTIPVHGPGSGSVAFPPTIGAGAGKFSLYLLWLQPLPTMGGYSNVFIAVLLSPLAPHGCPIFVNYNSIFLSGDTLILLIFLVCPWELGFVY